MNKAQEVCLLTVLGPLRLGVDSLPGSSLLETGGPSAPATQWSWASSSYFSQNLSVKGMQVRNSHHSQRTG